MRLFFLFLFSLIFITNSIGGTMHLDYTLSWQKPNAHYFDISIHIKGTPEKTTSLRIPAWRPGRYVMQNFTKNIIEVRALSKMGTSLPIQQIDKDTWQITNGTSSDFFVKYKAYAFELDAGNSFLDDTEAYINPVTMMMYIPGNEQQPLSLHIKKPDDWKIITPLDAGADGIYHVADYHTLVDSPFLISPDFKIYQFTYDGAKIQLAIQGEGIYQPDSLIRDVRKIVKTEAAIFNGLPFKRYVFIYHFMSRSFGHGVEHKDATSIVVGPANFTIKKNYKRFLGITAHEFFHVWNVERIRPARIYLPDYSKEEYSSLMWFFEGVTSYYDDLALCRAGLLTPKAYLKRVANNIRRMQENPGHKISSPALASFQSWGKFNGAPPNTSVSFYTSGAVMGALLDLKIRHLTNNKKSLDDVMRYLFKNYALKKKGVPENGILSAVDQVSGHSFKAFFNDYIDGTKDLDYNGILKFAGLQLIKQNDPDRAKAYLGVSVTGPENRVRNILPGSPAFKSGLDLNDELVAIDGKKVEEGQLNHLLKLYNPGDEIAVIYFHHNKLNKRMVTLGSGHNKKWRIRPMEKKKKAANILYKDWLGLK